MTTSDRRGPRWLVVGGLSLLPALALATPTGRVETPAEARSAETPSAGTSAQDQPTAGPSDETEPAQPAQDDPAGTVPTGEPVGVAPLATPSPGTEPIHSTAATAPPAEEDDDPPPEGEEEPSTDPPAEADPEPESAPPEEDTRSLGDLTAAPATPVAPDPPPAEERKGPDVSTHFTDDFEFRFWQMPDRLPGFEDRDVLDYFEQVNRFTANITLDDWSIYAQLDQVALTGNSYFLNDERRIERPLLSPGAWSPLIPGAYDPAELGVEGWDLISRNLYFNLEKLRVAFEKGDFTLHVGDTYVVFGRGIALNANRNVDIDIDTSMQGVYAAWRPGLWEAQAFFGQMNRQQVFQDNPNRDLFGDRRHTVGGFRLDRYGLGPVNLGAHGVAYNFVTDEGWEAGFENLSTAPDVIVGGANVEAFGLGPTDWYLEGDVFAYPTDATWGGEKPKPGYAMYLSSAIYAGPTVWLVEGKRYYEAERVNRLLAPELYEIAVSPTLEYERAITQDSAEAVNSNDLWGARVRMDAAAIPGVLSPYWSMAIYRDVDLELHYNPVPETIYHPVVGLEYTEGDWAVFFNAGYRIDDRDGREFGADRQLHGDIISKIPVSHGWFLDVSVGAEWFRWGKNETQLSDYAEMEGALAVQYGSLFALTLFCDYSDNPLIDSVGNFSDTVYGAVEVQVQPLPALTLKAFYGSYKSGIRCSGGQCRVLPGFEGARFSLNATF